MKKAYEEARGLQAVDEGDGNAKQEEGSTLVRVMAKEGDGSIGSTGRGQRQHGWVVAPGEKQNVVQRTKGEEVLVTGDLQADHVSDGT
ncbi:hypothetical protein BHM03_00003128 [Ensete ventricosum]|nr:hypothetical protein BHM03_00003128 [Ensete ventricosum]